MKMDKKDKLEDKEKGQSYFGCVVGILAGALIGYKLPNIEAANGALYGIFVGSILDFVIDIVYKSKEK